MWFLYINDHQGQVNVLPKYLMAGVWKMSPSSQTFKAIPACRMRPKWENLFDKFGMGPIHEGVAYVQFY